MIKKEDIKALSEALHSRNISRLSNVEFVLWLSWLDQRSGFREFRIVSVEEDFKVLCTYGIRLVIDGREFINSMAAIELAEKFFVSLDSATLEDWSSFLERIVELERPRVLPNYSFRKRIGMPDTASLFEVYVLSVETREQNQ